MSWFNDKFFAEVSGPLTMERFYRRHMPVSAGGGSPDTEVIRAARHNIRYHLAHIGWLVRTRDWLAGERLTYADLAAAAHLSSVDYLGDVPWKEDEAAKNWYARVKSRPSFRPILAETDRRHSGVRDLRQPRLLNDPAALKAELVAAARAHGFDVVGRDPARRHSARPGAAGALPRRRRARRHGLDGGDGGTPRRSRVR